MVPLTTLFIFVVTTAILYQWRKMPTLKAFIGGGALALAFALPHLWFTTDTDGYLPLFTIVLCAVYALFALGLNIVVGFAGLLDLGYVAFFLFGAYVGAWYMSDFAVTGQQRARAVGTSPSSTSSRARPIPGVHISFWLVIIIAGARRRRWPASSSAPRRCD